MESEKEKIKANSEKTNLNSAKQYLMKFWKQIVLGGAAIITVITKYQTLFNWLREIDISHLSKSIIIILAVVALLSVVITIFLIKKKQPNINMAIAFIFIATISGGLITIQQGSNFDKIIVVYDKITPEYHPNGLENVSSKLISDIDKLISSGDIDSRTVLLSTVNRPVLNWKKNLPNHNKTSIPILSLQEVIDKENTDIIDVSFSSFDKYLDDKIQSLSTEEQDLRIFYEDGYEQAEKQLSSRIEKSQKDIFINPIKFNSKSFTKLLETNSIVVFLGSPIGLESFIANSSSKDYKLLLVPNWLRPNIKPLSVNDESNRICVTSSVFDNIVNSDYESWNKITTAVTQQWNSINELKTNILISFVDENYPTSINF